MSAKWHAVILCVRNWEDRRLTRNVVCCNIYVIYCHSGILHLCVTSIFNFKICLMLEAGTPAASFIKFTTNLLSAAIKDAVFVEGNGHSSDKVPRGEKKGPFLRSPSQAHPEQASQAALPSPVAAAAAALARWRLLPNFPQRFPAPIPIRQRERERERERHRPV